MMYCQFWKSEQIRVQGIGIINIENVSSLGTSRLSTRSNVRSTHNIECHLPNAMCRSVTEFDLIRYHIRTSTTTKHAYFESAGPAFIHAAPMLKGWYTKFSSPAIEDESLATISKCHDQVTRHVLMSVLVVLLQQRHMAVSHQSLFTKSSNPFRLSGTGTKCILLRILCNSMSVDIGNWYQDKNMDLYNCFGYWNIGRMFGICWKGDDAWESMEQSSFSGMWGIHVGKKLTGIDANMLSCVGSFTYRGIDLPRSQAYCSLHGTKELSTEATTLPMGFCWLWLWINLSSGNWRWCCCKCF